MQKRFLNYFLKDEANGWEQEARVQMYVRRPFTSAVELRTADTWPLPNTVWTPIFLDCENGVSVLSWQRPKQATDLSFQAMGKPLTSWSQPLERDTEITGPLAARLTVSSSTVDADLFLTVQAFSPDGIEVDFQGTVDPRTPLAQGWLRALHRKLDSTKSLPYRPYHSHDEIQLLVSGRRYDLDIEIWPTNISLPAGYQLTLQIGGKDFERPAVAEPSDVWRCRGSGPWLHNHPEDRPKGVYDGETTIHIGSGMTGAHLVLPLISVE